MPEVAIPTDRRERYRAFMRKCDPVAPAELAIQDRLVCDLPGPPIHRKLAARADLAPGRQQLLVGGIGSGKTTQLLLAKRELESTGKTLPIYVDVAKETHIQFVEPGALLASIGVTLWRAFSEDKELEPLLRKIEKLAHPTRTWVDPWERDENSDAERGGWRETPGTLSPPRPALMPDAEAMRAVLGEFLTKLRARDLELVVIADGLDRLVTTERFWRVAEQDLSALKALTTSVIVSGPLSLRYGQGRDVTDYFEETHHLLPHSFNPKDLDFLMQVLTRRGAEEMIDAGELTRICIHSGGIPRDLISLARSSAENAYLDDEDSVQTLHVDLAIDQLGSKYLMGIGQGQRRRPEAGGRDAWISHIVSARCRDDRSAEFAAASRRYGFDVRSPSGPRTGAEG